jgi:hypothetical protein
VLLGRTKTAKMMVKIARKGHPEAELPESVRKGLNSSNISESSSWDEWEACELW